MKCDHFLGEGPGKPTRREGSRSEDSLRTLVITCPPHESGLFQAESGCGWTRVKGGDVRVGREAETRRGRRRDAADRRCSMGLPSCGKRPLPRPGHRFLGREKRDMCEVPISDTCVTGYGRLSFLCWGNRIRAGRRMTRGLVTSGGEPRCPLVSTTGRANTRFLTGPTGAGGRRGGTCGAANGERRAPSLTCDRGTEHRTGPGEGEPILAGRDRAERDRALRLPSGPSVPPAVAAAPLGCVDAPADLLRGALLPARPRR